MSSNERGKEVVLRATVTKKVPLTNPKRRTRKQLKAAIKRAKQDIAEQCARANIAENLMIEMARQGIATLKTNRRKAFGKWAQVEAYNSCQRSCQESGLELSLDATREQFVVSAPSGSKQRFYSLKDVHSHLKEYSHEH